MQIRSEIIYRDPESIVAHSYSYFVSRILYYLSYSTLPYPSGPTSRDKNKKEPTDRVDRAMAKPKAHCVFVVVWCVMYLVELSMVCF